MLVFLPLLTASNAFQNRSAPTKVPPEELLVRSLPFVPEEPSPLEAEAPEPKLTDRLGINNSLRPRGFCRSISFITIVIGMSMGKLVEARPRALGAPYYNCSIMVPKPFLRPLTDESKNRGSPRWRSFWKPRAGPHFKLRCGAVPFSGHRTQGNVGA